jgi:hypothetical protein
VDRDDVTAEAARGAVGEIEGFLLWEAEKSGAAARARAFSARLTGLTDAEREEVARYQAEEQLALAEGYLRRVAARSVELRQEYEERYRLLRRRLVGLLLFSVTLTVLCLSFTLFAPAPGR